MNKLFEICTSLAQLLIGIKSFVFESSTVYFFPISNLHEIQVLTNEYVYLAIIGI